MAVFGRPCFQPFFNHLAEFAARLPPLSSLTPRPPLYRSSIFLTLPILIWICGCGPPGEIQEYVIDVEDPKIYTSDLLKNEFGTLPFQWAVPQEWTSAANDKFSKAAWEVEEAGEKARITVSQLGIGPGIPAQVTRWQGQVGAEGDPASNTESLSLKDGKMATYIDMPGPDQSILGLMLELGDDLWIFKFRGGNTVVAAERNRFRKFCESIAVE